MSEREKTYVEDVNRSIYDIRNEEKDVYRIKKGLTPDIVAEISEKKKDPAWMANFRLQSLQIYNEMEVPDWGPSIEGLNMEDIVTYVKPNTHMSAKWSEVPEDIKDTFEKLGIPQAERKSLAGVGAQYDSELVYHNVREEVAAQGVVYTDMESALNGEYADMVRKHFMKLVTPRDHKFAALHGAVWSGRLLRICSPRSVCDDSPAVLFSTERTGSRTVRAYPDHCGRGCIPAFYRRLFRPEVQRGEPPCRLCGAVRGEKCKTALLHHRELVQEYVQSEYQAGVGGRRRYHRMGIRFLRIPRILSVPHERAER